MEKKGGMENGDELASEGSRSGYGRLERMGPYVVIWPLYARFIRHFENVMLLKKQIYFQHNPL